MGARKISGIQKNYFMAGTDDVFDVIPGRV